MDPAKICEVCVFLRKEAMLFPYNVVKDSSSDLGVNFKIVQIDPQLRLSAPKFQKKFFAYMTIFLYF